MTLTLEGREKQMKKVTTIAAKTREEIQGRPQEARLRVCAYCRVSSNSNEQMESFETQVNYYTKYINSRPEWEFANVYADGGISGTGREQRTEFNKLLKDCEHGKIDLIITKSISRFARNTADCLEVVRFLKSLGVAVYFERENINTMDAESELILSVLSSIAQEESRSISENIRWSVQKRFRQGKVRVTTSRFLGYDSDEKGELVINPAEAEIVKRIFREYIAGNSIREIKKGLEGDGVKTATGLAKWPEATLRGILTNEKYYGDALLQKTYTPDNLTHKKKRNKGEVPLYHVKANHEPIISKEEFEQVQKLMAERAAEYGNLPEYREKYARQYAFSGRIICGSCGAVFKRRTWNTKLRSKQIVWQCSTYIKEGKAQCSMKALDDITLKKVFLRVFNRLYRNKEAILKPFMENVQKALLDGLKSESAKTIDARLEDITGQMKQLIRQQIKEDVDPTVFQNEYRKLKAQLDKLREERNKIGLMDDKHEEILKRTEKIYDYLQDMEDMLTEFDDDIFGAMVEHILVISPTHLKFELKNGLVLEEKFIKKKGIHGLQ